MITIVATIVAMHFLAVGAVLLLARHSVMLVDEAGRPLKRGLWKEHVVPSSELPAAASHH
jgi:hypothetical protein